jgi:hypothetical protein
VTKTFVQTELITAGKLVQSENFKVDELLCVWSVLHFVLALQVRNCFSASQMLTVYINSCFTSEVVYSVQ